MGAVIIHLRPPLLAAFRWALRPSRATYPEARAGSPRSLPQTPAGVLLVLLQVGFAVPRLSPAARWSLTPPFHPYPDRDPRKETVSGRFVFCGTVPRVTPGGRYPPPRPVEPGLSSACAAITRPTRPIGHSMPRSPQPRTRHPARHNARREPATRHECHARQCDHGRAPQSGRHHESC